MSGASPRATANDQETVGFTPQIAAGTAESLMTLFINFGCLTVTWLCVTVGVWRRP
jgi:hypothetical protein